LKKLISILIITANLNCFGQKQDLKYASINIISSSLISGIGSGFHKHENETFGHAFMQGIWKGMAGGTIEFASKKMVQQSSYENNYNWIWPARLVNSLGSSMVLNGFRNDQLLSSVNINVWFVNMSFNGRMHFKVDPYTMISSTVLCLNKNFKFNMSSTLQTGSIVFDKYYSNLQMDNNKLEIYDLSGRSYGNTLFRNVYTSEIYAFARNNNISLIPLQNYTYATTCHEIIHTFQYENSYLDLLNVKYIYLNPYFGINYLINNARGYNSNVFEQEADYFGKSTF
jgi:hypothetical protein